MVRVLLTLCFTVTSLFGPALCCCATKAAADTDGPAKRACCSSGHAPAKSDGPARRPHQPSECPCKKDKPAAGLARAEAPEAAGEWPATGATSFAPNDSFDLTFRHLPPAGRRLGAVAPVSTAELLRAHHRLRC